MARTSREPRGVALDVLRKLDGGAFAQFVLSEESKRAGLDRRDTRFVWELSLGVERWRAYLDDAISPLLRRGIEKTDPLTLMIIRLGVYQLLFMDRVPARAAVHATVELAKSRRGEAPGRFVNGVLRALQRSQYEPPSAETSAALAIRQSHPEWLVDRYIADETLLDAEARCQRQNRPADLVVRCPSSKHRADVMASLIADGAEVRETQWSARGLRISGHPDPFNSATFVAGDWIVQDESSQLAVELLEVQQGEDIWDVCAAPGGKTRYLSDLMNGEGRLLATDLNAKKIERLRELLSVDAECRAHDGRQPLSPETTFDRVLLDAPCTALGLVRRHPEIRWRRTEDDIQDRAVLQGEILHNVANHVRPGGVVVYSVCSDTVEEGPEQIEAFLDARQDYVLDLPSSAIWDQIGDSGSLKLYPHHHDCDGFFAARLRRLEDR